MSEKLSLSKHAREKLRQRRIPLEELERVLENPQYRFYDVTSRSEVAIGEASLYGMQLSLAIIYRRRNGKPHIVTAYPVREVEEEIERKVKDGRWIIIG